MSNNIKQSVLLVGAGSMALDYFKVLKALEIDTTVVGRGELSAKLFFTSTGINPSTGGLSEFLKKNEKNFSKAIITVGTETLKDTSIKLLNFGIKELLVEKPAALNFKEIDDLESHTMNKNAAVFVAYNRRFYSSVLKAKEIIETDGGVTSFNFEFTEWSHIIEKLEKAPGVKENWFLGNSTHVVDLAFYLGGQPNEISCYTTGGLDWHPSASIFSGAGIAKNGALFSYQANWEAPGRWGVEILTKKHRLILRPLEKLKIQEIGSVSINEIELNNNWDIEFKPGLYLQTKAFINNNKNLLLNITQHWHNCKYYKKILSFKK